jgi:hypothetical protein
MTLQELEAELDQWLIQGRKRDLKRLKESLSVLLEFSENRVSLGRVTDEGWCIAAGK